jgi:hypothetical protein
MCIGYLRCRASAYKSHTVTRDIGRRIRRDEQAMPSCHSRPTAIGGPSVNKMRLALSIAGTFGGLVCASIALAQLPPAAKAPSVAFTQQPTLESAHDDTAIIRWSTNNPGGTDDHFGIVQYGMSPGALDQTAKSHIRLNRGHNDAMFRVRMDGLTPGATYYYKVTSVEANGTSDGVESDVDQFTMPSEGQRIQNYPPPN